MPTGGTVAPWALSSIGRRAQPRVDRLELLADRGPDEASRASEQCTLIAAAVPFSKWLVSLGLGVGRDPGVQNHARLVAHGPRVVPWVKVDDVPVGDELFACVTSVGPDVAFTGGQAGTLGRMF